MAKVRGLFDGQEHGQDRRMLALKGVGLDNESKRLDNAHKWLDLKSKELEAQEKQLAFRKKMEEPKLAGLGIQVSADADRNPVIEIAESAGLLPGSIEVCGSKGDRRVSVPEDLGDGGKS